jgi:hypothetical protein
MNQQELQALERGLHGALDHFGGAVTEEAVAYARQLPDHLSLASAVAVVSERAKALVEGRVEAMAAEVARLSGEQAPLSLMALMYPNGPVGTH